MSNRLKTNHHMASEELKHRAEVIWTTVHVHGEQLLFLSTEEKLIPVWTNMRVSKSLHHFIFSELCMFLQFANSSYQIPVATQKRGLISILDRDHDGADLIPTPPQTWPPNPNLSTIHIFNHRHFFGLWGTVFQFLSLRYRQKRIA